MNYICTFLLNLNTSPDKTGGVCTVEHMGFEPTASTMRMWRAPNCANAPKNGSNGARTHDLSRVRRTLIPAELCFHVLYYNICRKKIKRRLRFFQKNMKTEKDSVPKPGFQKKGVSVQPSGFTVTNRSGPGQEAVCGWRPRGLQIPPVPQGQARRRFRW